MTRPAPVTTAEQLVRRLVDVMKACDPEYCAAHDWEPCSDQDWDAAIESAEDWLEQDHDKLERDLCQALNEGDGSYQP